MASQQPAQVEQSDDNVRRGSEDVHSDDGSANDHVYSKEAATPLTKRQKLRGHCGRFWWWYLIAVIVLLAILLPIFFKIVIPKIVQDLLNDQDLPLSSGALRVISPTALNFTLGTSLNTPLGVRIDPVDLNLYNADTTPFSPFLRLGLPETNVNGETQITVTNQTVTILDEDELITWFHKVFDQPQTKLSIRGEPKIHLGALEYNPSLEKTIDVDTLNYLQGFTLLELKFILPPNEKGYNIQGRLNIPNSGSLSIGLGNLTFNMLSGDIKLGLVHAYNVELQPGDNSQFFEGEFYLQELVPNLGAILDSQKEALGHGNVEFTATGNMTVVNGQRITFIEKVLNTKRITFGVPVITVLSDVANGLLGGGDGSLIDVLGEAVGNATLFEHLLSHWETAAGNETTTPSVKKRSVAGSLMLNMLRLGLRKRV